MIENLKKYFNFKNLSHRLLYFIAFYVLGSIIFLVLLFKTVDKYLKNQTQNKAKIMASAIDYYKLSKLITYY